MCVTEGNWQCGSERCVLHGDDSVHCRVAYLVRSSLTQCVIWYGMSYGWEEWIYYGSCKTVCSEDDGKIVYETIDLNTTQWLPCSKKAKKFVPLKVVSKGKWKRIFWKFWLKFRESLLMFHWVWTANKCMIVQFSQLLSVTDTLHIPWSVQTVDLLNTTVLFYCYVFISLLMQLHLMSHQSMATCHLKNCPTKCYTCNP